MSGTVRRLVILGIGVLLTVGMFGLALIPYASAEAPGSWTQTTQYPFDAYATSCAASGATIVCVGGLDSSGMYADVNTVEYATLSGSGISSWTATTSFPSTFYAGTCATYSGYIYCVGGFLNGEVSQDVYSAPVSGSGVGTWTLAGTYPILIEGTSCVTSNGYITCVGGTSYDDTGITQAVYSAAISGGAVGTWTEQTDYQCTSSCMSDTGTGIPTADLACVLTGTSPVYVTCTGGEEKIYVGGEVEYDYPNAPYAYSATLSSGTVGSTWIQTNTPTSPPAEAGSCVSSNSYVYCLAGYDYANSADEVWYAQASSGVLGTWTQAADYGQITSTTQCVVYSGDIYCATGYMADQDLTPYSYYTTIGASSSSSSSSSSTTTTTTTTTSTTTSTTSSSVTAPTVPVCPSTFGGTLMPIGATFTDLFGNVWVAPGGSLGGGTVSSYFFPGPESNIPPPMMEGWGGVYGTYGAQQGWIISFFCA